MRIFCVSSLLCIGLVATLQGQLAPEIAAGLKSSDWTARTNAYNRLARQANRSRDEDTALVALLQREVSVQRQPSLDGPLGKDEGYSEYLASLVETVMKIAEKEPERVDVWPALASCTNDGDSAFGRWLATHSDKTAALLEVCAKDTNELFRGQGLTSLAQIVAYERQPATIHHLSSIVVDALDAMVRDGLKDSNPYIRMRSLMALAIMGTRDDLAILEKIAATDPAFDAQTAAEGPQFNPYPVRYSAGIAIERLQAKLKAQQ